jgi:hypothetical protein
MWSMTGFLPHKRKLKYKLLLAKSLLSQIYKLVSRKAKQCNIFDEFKHEDNVISFKERIHFA